VALSQPVVIFMIKLLGYARVVEVKPTVNGVAGLLPCKVTAEISTVYSP
jgi:hypothetical protein